MIRRTLRVSLRAGVLLIVTGTIAWASGRPFIFPSLGPSAFARVADPGHAENRAHNVVGGHLLGVVFGLLAYRIIAPELVITVEHGAGDDVDPSAPGAGS